MNTSQDGILWLTGALVLITGFYAWQTYQLVKEMRRARSAQLLPHPTLTVARLGGGNLLLRIANAGPGAALNVRLRILLAPNGPERHWETPLMTPGEVHDFAPDPTGPNGRIHMDDFTAVYESVAIVGSCADALGEEHAFEERLNIREYWSTQKASEELLPHDWEKTAAEALRQIADTVVRAEREQRTNRLQARLREGDVDK